MALGNTREQSDKKLYILKIKSKVIDKETKKEIPALPHVFSVLEKVDGKWVVQDDTITSFSGDLTGIEFEKDSWNETEYHVIKLKFTDQETQEAYLLDARCSSDFRNLANSILNLDPKDTTGLRINLYKSTSKQNGKEYSNISLWQNEKHILGKYAWKDMPAVEKIKFKGQEMSDTTNLDEWTIEKLKAFAAEMGGQAPATKAPVVADKPKKAKAVKGEEVPTGISDDEIPF